MAEGQRGTDHSTSAHLVLTDRIDITPGEIRIALSIEALASALDIEFDRIAEELLTITAPFRHRKRGVETRLVLGDAPTEIDETLLRNIARGHRYFDLIRKGKTFGEVAATEQVSKRRVQQLIELAFLAPDVIRAVRDGKQPTGLTSEWLMRHAVSPIWQEQRGLFATL